MNGNFIYAEKKRYSNEEIPPTAPGTRFSIFCQLLLFQSNALVINIPEIFSNPPTTIPTLFAIITQAPSKKIIWWKGFHHQVCHCQWFQQLPLLKSMSIYTFFLINSLFLTLTLKIVEAFVKNCPKKLFSNCLVDGLLTSIV